MEHSLRRPQSIADDAIGNTPSQTVSYSVNQSFFIELSNPHHIIRRHFKNRSKQDQKVTTVVVTVVVVFFITYLPLFVVRLVIIIQFIATNKIKFMYKNSSQ